MSAARCCTLFEAIPASSIIARLRSLIFLLRAVFFRLVKNAAAATVVYAIFYLVGIMDAPRDFPMLILLVISSWLGGAS